MNLERVGAIVGIVGGLVAIGSTVFFWLSKARESDLILRLTLDQFSKDLDRTKADLADFRTQQRESATRAGRRISTSRTILLRFINHFNTEVAKEIPSGENLGFKFLDTDEDFYE